LCVYECVVCVCLSQRKSLSFSNWKLCTKYTRSLCFWSTSLVGPCRTLSRTFTRFTAGTAFDLRYCIGLTVLPVPGHISLNWWHIQY